MSVGRVLGDGMYLLSLSEVELVVVKCEGVAWFPS